MAVFRPTQFIDYCNSCRGKRGMKCDLCNGRGIMLTKTGEQIVSLIRSEFVWPWVEAKVIASANKALFDYNLRSSSMCRDDKKEYMKELKKLNKQVKKSDIQEPKP